jgi:hypothetical protein
MKRAIVLACALALLLQSVAMSAAGKRVTDATGAISVEVPKGWSVEKNMAECQKLNIVGPSHSGLCSAVSLVTKNAEKLTLEIIAKGIEKNPSVLDPGCKIVSRSKTKLGGVAALVYVCDSAPVPKMPASRFEAVIAIRNKTAYLLTYSASKGFFKADRAALDTVTKSLKWVK